MKLPSSAHFPVLTRVDCDAKRVISFSVQPLPRKSLSEIQREANLKYRLRRNLFHPDGRLKARWGGKPEGIYTLEWHTKKIRDPLALRRFLKARDIILSCGCCRQEFRKKHIVFIDEGLYNRFMLLPNRKHFWLAVKGVNLHEEGLHSYSDGISTFFRITSDIPMERLREIILRHASGRQFRSHERREDREVA